MKTRRKKKKYVLFAYFMGKYIRIQESGKNTDLG